MKPCELRNPAGSVPVRDVDIGVAIDETAMRGAEDGRANRTRIKFVVRPLLFLRIIANERDRSVVAVEDDDSAFEFGDDGAIAVEADLAWAAKVLRDSSDVFAIEIEVAQAAVLAITNQQKRLPVAGIKGETMAAVQLAITAAQF